MSKMYYQDETMSQTVEVRSTERALVDPDTVVISIIDPEGAVKADAQNMTKDRTGEYSYGYIELIRGIRRNG